MKKIIICLIIIFTPLLVRADGHASKESSLVGEGAFNTLHVKAKNIGKYLTNLKSNTSTFKAIGADAAGTCVTHSGNNYQGEMFVWTAFSNIASAQHASTLYNPITDASFQREKLRKVMYSVTWKPLKPFKLNPGYERVFRMKVAPENINNFVSVMTELESAIIASGYDTFNLGVFQPIGGGVHESQTLKIRAILDSAKESGQLMDDFFSGASWSSLWLKARMISEITSDTVEICEQIYTAN